MYDKRLIIERIPDTGSQIINNKGRIKDNMKISGIKCLRLSELRCFVI
jgi:hypothetical protein